MGSRVAFPGHSNLVGLAPWVVGTRCRGTEWSFGIQCETPTGLFVLSVCSFGNSSNQKGLVSSPHQKSSFVMMAYIILLSYSIQVNFFSYIVFH